MEEFLRRIPKAEVHVHLEGTMTPETLLRLAAKNNIPVSGSLEELSSRRGNYANLDEFREDYQACCRVMKDSEDFYILLSDYLKKAHEEGILYCEVGIQPLFHPNTSFEVQITGLKRAAEEARNLYGIRCGFLLTFLRHRPIEQNYKTIADVAPFKDCIVGCGRGGPEEEYPASGLIDLFKEAQRQGLCGPDGGNISVHAGEEAGPVSVIDTLYALRPRRLDHGVRSLEDPDLVKFLSARQIPLAISPLSNKTLRVLDLYFNGRHIVRDLLDNNLTLCMNSDDRALAGGGVVENFLAVISTFSDQGEEDTKQKVVEMCRNSFKAAFLPQEEKDELSGAIDRFLLSIQ